MRNGRNEEEDEVRIECMCVGVHECTMEGVLYAHVGRYVGVCVCVCVFVAHGDH